MRQNTGMSTFQQRIRRILEKLAARHRKERILRGLLLLVIFLSLSMFTALLSHLLFGIDAVSRFAMIMVVASVGLTLLIHLVLEPLVRKPDRRRFSRALDRQVGGLDRSLGPVLDIGEQEGKPDRTFSRVLADRASERVLGTLESMSMKDLRALTGSGRVRLLALFVLLLLISSLGWYLVFERFPARGSVAWSQLVSPIQFIKDETVWRSRVVPADTSILRGDVPLITVMLDHDHFVPLLRTPLPTLTYRVGNEPWRSFPLVGGGTGTYYGLLGALDADCVYHVSLDRRRSPDYRIDVIDHPAVTWLVYSLSYPAYTGLENRDVQDRGEGLSVLRGSAVEIRGGTNNVLDSAWIELKDGAVLAAPVDDRLFTSSLSAREDVLFRIGLLDTLGNAGGDSLFRRLQVVPDRAPAVHVLSPGIDITAPKDMLLPLVVRAEDDFGILETELTWRREDSEAASGATVIDSRPRGASGVRSIQNSYVWDLSALEASPGDVVLYSVRVLDNDRVSGPKYGRSRTYAVRFPTMAEYLRQRMEGGGEIRTDMEEILTEARRLNELTDRLEKQLRGEEELDWEKQREIEEAAREGEELLEEIRDVCTRIEESLSEGGAELFSEDVLEKMMEVRDLLEKVATPEMREAIERMRRAMESLPPSAVERAMKNFRMKQDQLIENLDRTLTALKRLEFEQRLEAIEKGLGELAEKQERINEKAADPVSGPLEELAGEEGLLGEELAMLIEDMEHTGGLMDEQGETEAAAGMKELLEGNGEEVTEDVAAALEAMERGDRPAALGSGEGARQKLLRMQAALSGLTAALRNRWRQDVERSLARSLSDLVSLSGKQEEITQRTAEHGTRFGPDVGDMILEQQEVVSGLRVVSTYLDEASENSFFIGPDAVVSLGMATARAHEVAVELNRGEKTPEDVSELAREGLIYINRTAGALLRDLESLQCSASGTGLEEAFLQMQKMASMQAGINENTQQMLIPAPGSGRIQLTERERALLADLAAQQRAVARGLQELGDQLAGRRNVLGRLRDLARDAEELSRDMESQNVTPEIIERQRRTLSRLLDAQHSLQERDFSRERRARTAGSVRAAPPEELPEQVLRAAEQATVMELMETWKGIYPERYRELIFEYLQNVMVPETSGSEGGRQ